MSSDYFHSRSDSNTSMPSVTTTPNKSSYQYCDQWSPDKSTPGRPLQMQAKLNRRSSFTGSAHQYSDTFVNPLPVLTAKSVPEDPDRDCDSKENIGKISYNRNNPTPSSAYNLLASKPGFEFSSFRASRKSCPNFETHFAKYSERFLPKKLDSYAPQLWKAHEPNAKSGYGQENRYDMAEESPPPTPPVRDSSLASKRKFDSEMSEIESQNKIINESLIKTHYNKNSHYVNFVKGHSESRVSHIGCSKSLTNLRPNDKPDVRQLSQTYPLLPEVEYNDKSESWSCDQSVTSGVTSLVTTSDYFTASSSAITHSSSLSSLSTNATNSTYNNSRDSISSIGSSSHIAKSSKVIQPKRESTSILTEKSLAQDGSSCFKAEVPPPPPPKPNAKPQIDNTVRPTQSTCSALPKMVSSSRSIETSKSHRTSDPEIKAIQKRAVYQFYLKQIQKEKQEKQKEKENCNNGVKNGPVNSISPLDNQIVSHKNRKLTRDSGYESATASLLNWTGQNNVASNSDPMTTNHFHSRSDSNVSMSSSVSTAANKSTYQYCDQWSDSQTPSRPTQAQAKVNRRSSFTGSAHQYSEPFVNPLPVLTAKPVSEDFDGDYKTDENIENKSTHNWNNPKQSYHVQTSRYESAKSSRKSCGPNFDIQFAKFNERFLPKKMDPFAPKLWKTHETKGGYGQENRYDMTDESPPPTPPVRDSSLASKRKFDSEIESQNKIINESLIKTHFNKNSHYVNFVKGHSESRVNHIGCSKSLTNLRPNDKPDVRQMSQTYPLLPEVEYNDKSESWSCDQSVTSGVTSLVTTSDYFTASSSAITHSSSLSSLSTNATNSTYNNSRDSISSIGSSSQIAKSSKVVQPKRESTSILTEKSLAQDGSSCFKADVPPPPPPIPNVKPLSDNIVRPTQSTCSAFPKMVSSSRSIETSKSHRTSDPEIKAIQKRAVYQFYLKQIQKEKQEKQKEKENCNNDTNNAPVSSKSSPDNQVPSRKVHLVVHENIYENIHEATGGQFLATPALPSPPLPPPPNSSVAEMGNVQDLPLPPPPSANECQSDRITNGAHSDCHRIEMRDTYLVSKGLQTGRSPSPPKASSPAMCWPRVDSMAHKSETGTQTTDSSCRSASCSSNEVTQDTQQSEPSLQSSETMNQKPNEVPTQTTTGEESVGNESIGKAETVVPWAYSKLWPNDKCAKTSHYETDNSHISGTNTSPSTRTHTFSDDTGVELNNEDLLANKSELISRLSRKLDVLRSEETALIQDIDSNEMLGQQLRNRLKALGLTAQELEKINLHFDETEKVTRLLLSISARLQLIETQINEKNLKNQRNCSDECTDSQCKHNSTLKSKVSKVSKNDLQQIRGSQTAYSSTNSFEQQIQSLVSKRGKLLAQLDEALELRVSIDHRNQLIVDKIVRKYFKNSDENLKEFIEFVRMKSKLIVDIREVRDRIETGQKVLSDLQTTT